MKSYLVKEINLTKYIFLIFISFIVISILSILIILFGIKINPNLLIISNSLVFTFIILPRIKKVSSKDLTIKINNQSIYIDKLKIDISKINYVKVVYKFIRFPKIIIVSNNGDKYNLRIIKPEFDYITLIDEISKTNISKTNSSKN